jgi:hypothetical protein
MKKVYALISVFIFVLVAAALASDVADVAKKEKERRAKIEKSGKTYTNKDVDKLKKKDNVTDDNSAQSQPSDEDQATASDDDSAAQTQDDANSEEYWRNRYKEAKDKVAELQAEFDRTQTNLNQMQSSLAATGGSQLPGDAGGDAFRTLMAHRDEVKQQLDDAKAALDGLEDEARKAGVPPGWVRD